MKIVGIVNSQGDFNGKPYHNLVLHVTMENENTNKDVCGLLTDTIKLRYSDINDMLGLGLADPSDVEKLKAETFQQYVGKKIDVAYNKFGAVQSVKIYDDVTPKADTKPQTAVK